MNRHETIQDAYVYNPIVELTTEDVWDVLLRLDGGKTPWGTDNSELVSLYADADSGECPFAGIHAGGQTQSCGNSRFGCWVCTVVKEDKSLNGFIRSGHRELIPLAEFRKWLMSIRDIPEYREKKKRNGSIYKDKDGNIGYGPFTWEARKMILSELIKTQQKMNYELITIDELKAKGTAFFSESCSSSLIVSEFINGSLYRYQGSCSPVNFSYNSTNVLLDKSSSSSHISSIALSSSIG